MLFLGATIGGLIQGLSLKRLMVILARTTVNLRKTVVTICSLIALASVMNYSGMITSIASGLVALTGDFYPLVAPMIGAIGTFVTGSDTSSNILFAKLHTHVANQLGMTGAEHILRYGGRSGKLACCRQYHGSHGWQDDQSAEHRHCYCSLRYGGEGWRNPPLGHPIRPALYRIGRTDGLFRLLIFFSYIKKRVCHKSVTHPFFVCVSIYSS